MPKSQTLPIRSHMLSLLIALYPCRLMIFNLGSSQLGGFLVRPLAGFKRKAFVPRSDFSKSNAQTSCACRHSQFAIACTASKAPGEPGENPARDAHWLQLVDSGSRRLFVVRHPVHKVKFATGTVDDGAIRDFMGALAEGVCDRSGTFWLTQVKVEGGLVYIDTLMVAELSDSL